MKIDQTMNNKHKKTMNNKHENRSNPDQTSKNKNINYIDLTDLTEKNRSNQTYK